MDIQTLSLRISECLDDLGLLLDQIYRFPQKQREAYFEKIHSLKNRLLMLKSTLRQYPPHTSEKQYKQIYLSMNALKNELTLQSSALSVAKQNREAHNRARDVKQAKRNYDDALKGIVEREEELRIMRLQLAEKEEVLLVNFSQMARMRTDLEILIQENRRLKFDHTTLQIQLDSARAAIDRSSDTTIQFRVRQQQKDLAFVSAIEELERLKTELIAANEKLSHFQQLAQVSIRKTRQVEENIKKVEREAQDLNQNYRLRENDNFRKLKQFGELEFQLGIQIDQNRQLQLQNRRLRQDIQVLQSQIIKANKNFNEKLIQAGEDRERLHLQVKRLVSEVQTDVMRESELKKMIEEGEKKYLIVIGKLNCAEEVKVRNKELEIKIQSLEQRIKRTEGMLQQTKKQALHFLREKQRIAQQLQSQMRANRETEIEVFKGRQKAKFKEQQRARLIQEVEMLHSKLKQSERALAVQEVARQTLDLQIAQERGKVARVEQKQRIKEKQIQGLKIKLLQAKIQTVHEIREVING